MKPSPLQVAKSKIVLVGNSQSLALFGNNLRIDPTGYSALSKNRLFSSRGEPPIDSVDHSHRDSSRRATEIRRGEPPRYVAETTDSRRRKSHRFTPSRRATDAQTSTTTAEEILRRFELRMSSGKRERVDVFFFSQNRLANIH
ncbi:hypothetical protein F2Q69_00016770 [Brassica cretica]|uniref:Uncharacterized protein n=1 Tax=Brassica cretica TaxID=69181 RepID=A0A8S9R0H2_BRACR|nr:hypothetical protein F2Q69_00016770 [Brassica cretica]